MEEVVRQRINEVLAYYKTNNTQISEGNSALQVKLSRQLKQGTAITGQTIMFILDKFPEVSAEWLLRGTGSMLLGEQTTNTFNVKGTDNSVEIHGDSQGDITTNGEKISGNDIILKLIEQNNKSMAQTQELINILAKK